LIFLLIVVGCAKSSYHPPSEETEAGSSRQEDELDEALLEKREAGLAIYARAPQAAKAHSFADISSSSHGSAASPPPQAPQAPVPPRPAAKRMVHYSGAATLRSTDPERIIDSAIALVKAGGGYLESRSPGFAALRVPAQDFDSQFVRLLRLAEVLDYNQQAEDITEAVQDTELRLKVVASTLERLEDLVKQARTESQKLRLLRELKRFREEKEVLESRRRDLLQRARFASIRLRVETHAPLAGSDAWRQDIADFRWIHALSPFDDRRFRGRSTFRFTTPDGMVVSRKRRPWRATSAQGSEFWGSEMDVDPRGDSRFWREAIRNRLENGFKSADTLKSGAFEFCKFKSFGPTPYYYWVGVRSRGDEIQLAEFYFPTEGEQSKLLPGLLAAVERRSR
jgi:hypothetical protein